MARPKKGEEKAKDAAVLKVSVEDFKRTRDSVVAGFDTLQAAVQELSRAYIVHTNTVLSRAPGSAVDLLATPSFAPLSGGAMVAPVGAPLGGAVNATEEKKKKKRYHDPNAPKRPLTPYFLYMQTARPIITKDLGGDAKPGAVSAEGTRRWKEMAEHEKQTWKLAYEKSLPEYRQRKAAYKASTTGADPAAAQLVAENGAAADEDEDEPSAVVTAAEPAGKAAKGAKRRKSGKADETVKATGEAAAPSKVTPVPAPKAKQTAVPAPAAAAEKEPESKKRKRSDRKSKADEAEAAAAEAAKKAETQASGKKERGSKKKRKSDVTGDA